jgi:hypothetical protein
MHRLWRIIDEEFDPPRKIARLVKEIRSDGRQLLWKDNSERA